MLGQDLLEIEIVAGDQILGIIKGRVVSPRKKQLGPTAKATYTCGAPWEPSLETTCASKEALFRYFGARKYLRNNSDEPCTLCVFFGASSGY